MRVRDLTGRVFGRLTVVKQSAVQLKKGATWDCQCLCGSTHTANSSNLIRGQTKSCGCFRREKAGKRSALPAGVSAFNSVYSTYETSASDRNYEFRLTKEEFAQLARSPCHYCQASPGNRKKALSGDFIYNGIDRVRNHEGYLPENCVACCVECNFRKGPVDMPYAYAMVAHDQARIAREALTPVSTPTPDPAPVTPLTQSVIVGILEL